MKKNKGFTLVELLAVVAILSILVIVALPNVIGMFGDAKKNSFMTECKQIYKVAQQEYISDSLFETQERTYAKCETQNCGTELDLSGRTNIQYFIKFNKAGKVTEFYVTDGDYQYAYDEGDLLITDITEVESIADLVSDSEKVVIACDHADVGGSSTPAAPVMIEICYVNNNLTLSKNYREFEEGTTVGDSGLNIQLMFPQGYFDCLTGKTINYTNVTSCVNSNRPQTVTSGTVLLSKDEVCYSLSSLQYPPTGGGGGSNPRPCLDADSEIDVYDKKKKKRLKKKLRDITYDDLVLAWDFDLGQAVWAKVLWIQKLMVSPEYYLLTFDNGMTLKVIGDHRIYSDDVKMFISAKTAPIGFTTITNDNKKTKLVSRVRVEEKIEYANIITDHHINVYANGILTSHGINNLYKIEDMKFVKENNKTFDRNELSEIDDELYKGLRLDETSCVYEGNKEETKIKLLEYINTLIRNKK